MRTKVLPLLGMILFLGISIPLTVIVARPDTAPETETPSQSVLSATTKEVQVAFPNSVASGTKESSFTLEDYAQFLKTFGSQKLDEATASDFDQDQDVDIYDFSSYISSKTIGVVTF